jgi:hypothetical protein
LAVWSAQILTVTVFAPDTQLSQLKGRDWTPPAVLSGVATTVSPSAAPVTVIVWFAQAAWVTDPKVSDCVAE